MGEEERLIERHIRLKIVFCHPWQGKKKILCSLYILMNVEMLI